MSASERNSGGKSEIQMRCKKSNANAVIVVAEKKKQILKEGIKETLPLISTEYNQTMSSTAPDKPSRINRQLPTFCSDSNPFKMQYAILLTLIKAVINNRLAIGFNRIRLKATQFPDTRSL